MNPSLFFIFVALFAIICSASLVESKDTEHNKHGSIRDKAHRRKASFFEINKKGNLANRQKRAIAASVVSTAVKSVVENAIGDMNNQPAVVKDTSVLQSGRSFGDQPKKDIDIDIGNSDPVPSTTAQPQKERNFFGKIYYGVRTVVVNLATSFATLVRDGAQGVVTFVENRIKV